MSQVAIVGYGNVGYHLTKRLAAKGHDVLVFSRNPQAQGVKTLSTIGDYAFDFILLTIPDDQIISLAKQLKGLAGTLLHTSGSRPLADLNSHEKSGVFYPLQTFSKHQEVDFERIQFFVEGQNQAIEEQVFELAKSICPNVRHLSSDKRAKLHLAAVFSCNFSNHMFHLAEEQLGKIGMKFQDLQPLVELTLSKALAINPSQAQTGPAIRNDHSTISKHIDLLEDEKMKKMYKLITESIQQSS